MFYHIDYIGIIVATIIYMIVGSLWYSPFLFGKKWAELAGMPQNMTLAEKAAAKKAMMYAFIPGLVLAFGLERLLYNIPMVIPAYTFPLVIMTWLSFSAAVNSTDYIYNPTKRPWLLFAINQGYYLVATLLMTFSLFYV